MKIYDITHTVNKEIAVWPGDSPFERIEFATIENGDLCNVSGMNAGLHVGTHIDAHYHYHKDGITIDEHNLENYIGPCQVIDVTDIKGKSIEIEDIKCEIHEKRIIFRTKKVTNSEVWNPTFKGISPDLVKYLSEKGVLLVGTDSPSVDEFNSSILKSHLAFYQYNVYILENLNLNDIKEGTYELIALPLKLEGADGSPVRAVLIEK